MRPADGPVAMRCGLVPTCQGGGGHVAREKPFSGYRQVSAGTARRRGSIKQPRGAHGFCPRHMTVSAIRALHRGASPEVRGGASAMLAGDMAMRLRNTPEVPRRVWWPQHFRAAFTARVFLRA